MRYLCYAGMSFGVVLCQMVYFVSSSVTDEIVFGRQVPFSLAWCGLVCSLVWSRS